VIGVAGAVKKVKMREDSLRENGKSYPPYFGRGCISNYDWGGTGGTEKRTGEGNLKSAKGERKDTTWTIVCQTLMETRGRQKGPNEKKDPPCPLR